MINLNWFAERYCRNIFVNDNFNFGNNNYHYLAEYETKKITDWLNSIIPFSSDNNNKLGLPDIR